MAKNFKLRPIKTRCDVRAAIVEVMNQVGPYDGRKDYLYALQLALATFNHPPERKRNGKEATVAAPAQRSDVAAEATADAGTSAE